jgi:hypothetical protein
LALLGGGIIALGLAGALPGLPRGAALVLLVIGGGAMTLVASIVGFVPTLVASLFAPLVVALTDPMWTLGATIADFTLGDESSATFAVFFAAAVLGGGYRKWKHRHVSRHGARVWTPLAH